MVVIVHAQHRHDVLGHSGSSSVGKDGIGGRFLEIIAHYFRLDFRLEGCVNIIKRGDKYRVEVCVNYKRRSKTFDTRRDAVAWGNEMESRGILPAKTFADAIIRYRPIAQAQRGAQARLSRMAMLERSPIALVRLEDLSAPVIAGFRDDRLKVVSPSSVRVELSLIGSILQLCRTEWGWMHHDPISCVRKPLPRPARRRGISDSEIAQIISNLEKKPKSRIVSIMFQISLETGMRLGELVGLDWADVGEKTVRVRFAKNGDDRDIPLSRNARLLFAQLRNDNLGRVFRETAPNVSQKFKRSSVAGVHFHDARSEAVTRLSQKLDVMQLARIIGHRDIRSLMYYYAEKAEAIADKL